MASIAGRKTRQSLRSERAFFLTMMVAISVLVVWGFAPSFYMRGWMTPPPTHIDRPGWIGWVFIGHGLLATLWLVLFAVQTVLIGSKRLPLHKAIGRSAWPLYFAVVITGLFVGWIGAKHGFHAVPFDSITFSALPWMVIVTFAILAAMGLRERRDPQRHKRLMLLSIVALSDAGIARVAFFYPFVPAWVSATVFLLVPIVLWDLWSLRRLHPVTIVGGIMIVVSLALSVPIGKSAPWHAFVTALIGSEGVPAGKIIY